MVYVKVPVTIEGVDRSIVVRSRDSNRYPFDVKLVSTLWILGDYTVAQEIAKKAEIGNEVRGIVERQLNEEAEVQEIVEQVLDELADENERVSR